MSCAFDLAHYRELLDAARDGGYRFAFFDHEPEAGELLLRHDVDLSLDAALQIAELEAEAGKLRTLAKLGHQLSQYGRGLGVAERHDLPALLELAQEEHVVHELGHLVDLVAGLSQQRLQVGARELGGLQQRLQPCERGAKLVRDGRREPRAECFVVGASH